MQIRKFTKQKNSMYVITLEDNSKIKAHEDLILKYDLLLSKTMTDELAQKIHLENQVYEIYEVALKYISIKLRGKKELISYLSKKGYTNQNIENVINMLTSQGYLDDTIYATSFIHDRMVLSNYGPHKIKDELLKMGIPDSIIMDKILVFTRELELERINTIINKQLKINTNKGGMVLKRKIQNHLVMLGYSKDLVNSELNKHSFYDEAIYQKEYKKIYDKLSRKYTGRELEYKLKQKLYQKGLINTQDV